MKIKNFFCFFLISIYTTLIYAKNSELTLTVINSTPHTLTYIENDTTQFSVDPKVIKAGEYSTIKGHTTYDYDLIGTLTFIDELGNKNILNIIDPRRFHMKQPVFSMHNKNIFSILKWKKENPDTNPRAILISEAKIELSC